MHGSRKLILAIAAGLMAAIAVAGIAFGITASQTLDAKFSPNKVPKKTFAKGAIEVRTTTADADNPSGMPPKATRALIFFDDDLKFTPKGIPTCRRSRLENTTTEVALQRCRDAKVGAGNAVAALPLGGGGSRADFPAVVTAFNGKRVNRKPTILLHSRVGAPINTTVVLQGVLKPARGDFGKKLDVDIPPLGGGAGAIAEFFVKVKRGKYVRARCFDRNRTWNYKGRFEYSDASAKTVSDTQRCRRR